MTRVVHFEIPADNPGRAADSYRRARGWTIDKWKGPVDYWLATTGEAGEPGINGAITSRENLAVTTNTVDVPSVDDIAGRIEAAGGRIIVPRRAVPGVGYGLRR